MSWNRDQQMKYILRESQVGIRMMYRDNMLAHAFDIGKTADGVEYSFVMVIVRKDQLSELMQPSKPLESPEKDH